MGATATAPVDTRESSRGGAEWSLLQLLRPEVLADPYPFYARLRAFEPVHWDRYTHAWVVSSYAECVAGLAQMSAKRTPSVEQLEGMGLSALEPYARTMLEQLMFLDAPQHTQLRALCMVAFTPKRVEALRRETEVLAGRLVDAVSAPGGLGDPTLRKGAKDGAPGGGGLETQTPFENDKQRTGWRGLVEHGGLGDPTLRRGAKDGAPEIPGVPGVLGAGSMEVIGEFAGPLPALMMTALLGIPAGDFAWLKERTTRFTELMGNFGHDPERMEASVRSLLELREYFANAVAEQRKAPHEGLVGSLVGAEIVGRRLTDDEIVSNLVLVVSGGFEEATNLIGSSVLTLLGRPEALARLRDEPEIAASAVEELLRFESPTQHTGRMALEDTVLGGKTIRAGSTVTLLLAAANRDPLRFAEPERLDLVRTDNRHLAFGWGAHYCMGAPLTRMVAQVGLPVLLRRLPGLRLAEETPVWRANMGMRGLERLRVRFDAAEVA